MPADKRITRILYSSASLIQFISDCFRKEDFRKEDIIQFPEKSSNGSHGFIAVLLIFRN
jgi:hypothetical protein